MPGAVPPNYLSMTSTSSEYSAGVRFDPYKGGSKFKSTFYYRLALIASHRNSPSNDMTTILNTPGTYPPNTFLPQISATVTSRNYSFLAEETAKHLVEAVTTSSDPTSALWELWTAFFEAVISSSSPDAHFALLDSIRAQPPTLPNNLSKTTRDVKEALRSHTEADGKLHWSELPRFGREWRHTYELLHQWRDWTSIQDAGFQSGTPNFRSSSTGGQLWLRFVNFSTRLLKRSKEHHAHETIWVFYTCKNMLEHEKPPSREQNRNRMSAEQVWALDVRVAAIWVRDGAQALWNTDYEELRKNWEAALDESTDLWPREDGLNRERWKLWGKRLLALSTDEASLDEETRGLVKEAYEMVEELLSNF
jgi:hypothetical protein